MKFQYDICLTTTQMCCLLDSLMEHKIELYRKKRENEEKYPKLAELYSSEYKRVCDLYDDLKEQMKKGGRIYDEE